MYPVIELDDECKITKNLLVIVEMRYDTIYLRALKS